MSFKDLNLNPTYSSSKDNLVNDFYSPVLSQSITYDRIAGFFNSSSLALVARGLKEFIINGGKMRLLCGVQLSKDDLNTIMNSSQIAENIGENFLNDLDSVSDEIEKNHLKLLAWMLDNDVLEIKIGIVKNEYGYLGGILHDKTGIFKDNSGNSILFSGSNNESSAGWSSAGFGNLEKFKVFLSWEDSKFMNDDIQSFEEDWNNQNKFLQVMDVPKAAEEGLIRLAPENLEELINLPMSYVEKNFRKKDDEKTLRKYQEKAISNWIDNNKIGIFEMATGAGKTFTAINCISETLKDHNNLITVIACPYAHIVEQWENEIKKILDIKIINAYGSGNPNWKRDLTRLVFNLKTSVLKNVIILTTHDTFSSDFFIEQIHKIDTESFLIIDEMHHISTETYRKGLLENYNYRLGLSATPYIYNDSEATELLFNYFSKIVYIFDLADGLTTYGEDSETFLTPYEYYPVKVQLNNKELKEYLELSDEISRKSHFNKDDDMSTSFRLLLIKRKNIINNAKAKYDCLRQILKSMGKIDHLIVFCSPQQKNDVLQILKDEGVKPSHKFTESESTRKSKQYGGISQREYLVKKFDEGFYKALVAIRCLDEGVDVPSADKVIIMSSSNNPKEYIQRKGRVLRRFEDKTKAKIYDMAVIQSDYSGELIKSITDAEEKRIMDFINLCENPDEGMELIKKWGLIL